MLRPQHTEHLMRFRIPSEMLQAAGVRSVTDAEARELLGLNGHRSADLGGILFPYRSPVTGHRIGGRVRLDHPLSSGGKYISEPGCRHLFFPPLPVEWLRDPLVPVVLVESEKAALALLALAERTGRRLVPVALGGCWGWRRKIGKRTLPNGSSEPETGAAPDLDFIVWEGRAVILTFDSNALTNREVRKARRALAENLLGHAARVSVVEVPAIEGVNGPDDLIAVSGDEAMLNGLDSAQPFIVINLRFGELPAAVDQAEDILMFHSERLGVFQHAGELVRVVSLPEPRKGGGLNRPGGSVQLEPLSAVALTEIFDRIARWQRIDHKSDARVVDCPPKISAVYLSRVGLWRVPVLAGIISAPILREDGTILAKPGYDKKTGLFFVSHQDWPAIPEQPTRADAGRALLTLLAPFSEFPFVGEEDRSVHIACIFTAIQRRLLEACPIFGYSAPSQRSGKTLLAEAPAILETGKPAPATAVSGEREELRKAITSALREGHSIINLDNIETPLTSPDLAKAITQPEYQDRVLGENRMVRLPTNVLWTATGNNLTFRGDLSSRALLSRIDSGIERPEERTFEIPNLKDFLLKNRRELVCAALTILRAFHVAGLPRQHVQPWGGFDNWSASIREPLVWVGLPDPCKTREIVLADDPELEESHAALLSLRDAFADGEFTVKEVMDHCRLDGELNGAIVSLAARRNAGDEIDPKRLGWWCRRARDRVIDRLRLCFCGKTSGVARWKIVEGPTRTPGGHGGFRGHSPATEGATQPSSNGRSVEANAGRSEYDPQNPCDHLDGGDEVSP